MFLVLACAALAAHANTDIEGLYARIKERPDAKTANQLIKMLYERGQADSLYIFKDDADPHLMMFVSKSMSYVYFDNGDYPKSINLCKEALNYADKENDIEEIVDLNVQISSSYISLSDYKTGINYCMKAISLAEKKGVTSLPVAYAYHNAALCYQNLKKFNIALKYIDKSISVEKKIGNEAGLSVSYGLASEIYSALKQRSKALNYIYKAIAISEKLGDVRSKAIHQLQAVDLHIDGRNFKEAEKASKEALAYFENNEPILETIICYKQMGQICLHVKKLESALNYLKTAESLSLQLNNKHQLLQVYEALAEVEARHNPSMALKYLNLRDALKDSIFSEETNRLVSDAEVKYDTSQKELKILEQQNEMKTRQMWFTVCISAAVVVILLIIVYVSISNSRKNKRHAAQLKVERDEATKARDEAERANALKGVFIDNVVHELRTPINAIQGFSQLLDPSFGNTEEETAEYLGYINENCNNLITLVQDTIDVSEMENENYPVTPTEVQLSAICNEAVANERHRLRETVNIFVAEKEDITVCTDRTLLSRMVGNLVSNACKYTLQGSITVEFHKGLWSERQGFSLEEMLQKALALQVDSGPIAPWNLEEQAAAAGDNLAAGDAILAGEPLNPDFAESADSSTPPAFSITVTDTGCGIAPEHAEKVFARFEKLGSYVPGNGMGLTIVRLIAHLLHGEAYLDTSYCGNGSRFVAEMRGF